MLGGRHSDRGDTAALGLRVLAQLSQPPTGCSQSQLDEISPAEVTVVAHGRTLKVLVRLTILAASCKIFQTDEKHFRVGRNKGDQLI